MYSPRIRTFSIGLSALLVSRISYGNAKFDYIRNPNPPISTFSPHLFTSLQPSAAKFFHCQVPHKHKFSGLHITLFSTVTSLSFHYHFSQSRALLCNVSSESRTRHSSSFATSIDVRHWAYATHRRGVCR